MANKSITFSNGTDVLYPESAMSGNGYQKCADGTLIQWGSGTFGSTTSGTTNNVTVSLSVAFANTNYVVQAWSSYRYPSQLDVVATVTSTSTITIYGVNRTSSSLSDCRYMWKAIGRWK